MPIELPWLWVAVLNVTLWPVLQLGWAWAFTRMPAEWFQAPRPCVWEKGGGVYERWFHVRRWKDRLPDGAAWFGGAGKKNLPGRNPAALTAFARETWRGELCHWVVIAMTPLFFLWNPLWADIVMVVYAMAANLPCVIAQRYNRARIGLLTTSGRRLP
jgi:glycosyl-4,4'-diaponeurosporenoate acyltransferase